MKRNFWKPILTSTLFVVVLGWLFLVWVPMIQRDNQIDPQQVIRNSQATMDSVRSKLQQMPVRNTAQTIHKESSDKDTAAPK